MPIHNADVARLFDRIADLLELAGENPFRVRAYRNASRMLTGLGKNVRDMLAKGEDLTELPGIGDDLAGKVREAVETGSVDLLRRLEKKLPAGLPSLLALPGLGPKRVRMLYDQLHVSSVEELARAAEQGKLEGLPGLGPKTVAKIVAAIATKRTEERRYLVSEARPIAEDLVAHLKKGHGLSEVVVAGSYRRGKETVGDLDVLVAAKGKTHVVERFVGYDEVVEVLAQGDTRAAVRLRSGIQVDLRLVPEESFGAALHYFTGSKAHNVALRKRAQERGLKVNEYGVFRGEERIAGETEASVFESVGLPFVPPELREDRGELEAAAKGKLPELVTLRDLRGDLHVHTKATDGHATMEEMVAAAKEAGLSYLAITEHSQRLKMVHGLDPDRLLAQVDAIAELNESLKGFTVLAGIEVDVLEDGALDLPDEVLSPSTSSSPRCTANSTSRGRRRRSGSSARSRTAASRSSGIRRGGSCSRARPTTSTSSASSPPRRRRASSSRSTRIPSVSISRTCTAGRRRSSAHASPSARTPTRRTTSRTSATASRRRGEAGSRRATW